MTDAEIDFMAKRLNPLLVDGLIWVAEAAGEPVGFMLALPDYNAALKPLRGRLPTPKLLGFLPYLLGWKWPPRCRIITLGVKEKYRTRGLAALMLTEGFKTGFRIGFKDAEASWILEDILMMCRLLEAFGGKPYKTYRLFEREVWPENAFQSWMNTDGHGLEKALTLITRIENTFAIIREIRVTFSSPSSVFIRVHPWLMFLCLIPTVVSRLSICAGKRA